MKKDVQGLLTDNGPSLGGENLSGNPDNSRKSDTSNLCILPQETASFSLQLAVFGQILTDFDRFNH
jgi:hypothetical protein